MKTHYKRLLERKRDVAAKLRRVLGVLNSQEISLTFHIKWCVQNSIISRNIFSPEPKNTTVVNCRGKISFNV